MCLSTKFPHQEIRSNYGIFSSVLVAQQDLHQNKIKNSIDERLLNVALNDIGLFSQNHVVWINFFMSEVTLNSIILEKSSKLFLL